MRTMAYNGAIVRFVFTCCVLLAIGLRAGCEAKVIRGTVSSRRAWEEKGQFVSKFCFHGEGTVFSI